jgi:hypothetical protein
MLRTVFGDEEPAVLVGLAAMKRVGMKRGGGAEFGGPHLYRVTY